MLPPSYSRRRWPLKRVLLKQEKAREPGRRNPQLERQRVRSDWPEEVEPSVPCEVCGLPRAAFVVAWTERGQLCVDCRGPRLVELEVFDAEFPVNTAILVWVAVVLGPMLLSIAAWLSGAGTSVSDSIFLVSRPAWILGPFLGSWALGKGVSDLVKLRRAAELADVSQRIRMRRHRLVAVGTTLVAFAVVCLFLFTAVLSMLGWW